MTTNCRVPFLSILVGVLIVLQYACSTNGQFFIPSSNISPRTL